MNVLLDANVLVGLMIPSHTHHEAARRWYADGDITIATCPITEGALTRLVMREGRPAMAAQQLLAALEQDPRHAFWPDALGYAQVRMTGVIGHRQVTDAYLAQLARSRDGRLATFDSGLAALHEDVAELVATH